jgi:hypothetical protein
MDFFNYKFVVSTGCSYGRLADYTFNWFEYTPNYLNLIDEYGQRDWLDLDDNKIISINLSLSSQGSDWQSDSIIHVVNELLKLGVKSENIFCLVEWSQWHRFATHPPHHYDLNLNNLNFNGYEYGKSVFNFRMFQKNTVLYEQETLGILSYLYDYFKLFKSQACESWGKIGERIYMIPRIMNANVYRKLGMDYEIFYEDIIKIENHVPLENKINDYLNNILRTQYFFEKNNVKYNFAFMQSTLSDWEVRDSGILQHPLFNGNRNQYDKNTLQVSPKFNPINNPESDIENIMPELKFKVEQINFNNFWFYETDRFRRGGIDEWTIDNLKETGFVETLNNLNVDVILPNFGNHPGMTAYILLWNKITFNCDFVKVKPDFKKFIWDKYWEDYNYDGVSKNNITLSKKEWDRIIKKSKLI